MIIAIENKVSNCNVLATGETLNLCKIELERLGYNSDSIEIRYIDLDKEDFYR